jgi:hypothetical protein
MGWLFDRQVPRRTAAPDRRWCGSTMLEELQPIAVRIFAVEAAHPREVVVEVHWVSSCLETPGPLLQVAHQQAWMCLPCWPKVLLHSKMQFDAMPAKPATTTSSKNRRLVDLVQPEYATEELP